MAGQWMENWPGQEAFVVLALDQGGWPPGPWGWAQSLKGMRFRLKLEELVSSPSSMTVKL